MSFAAAVDAAPPRIAAGSGAFARINLALFLGGFATFSLLYCVQPLLPEFVHTFGVSPAESALALSLATGFLAVAIMIAAAFSQAVGRRGLMFVSMALAAAMNLAAAMSSTWPMLLVFRGLEGLVLGGVPAVAMAYVAEEIEPRDLAGAMGLYVAGTAFGGMMGRVGMGVLTEFASWRAAMGVMGLLGLVAATAFFLLLPPSRHFERRPTTSLAPHLVAWARHLAEPSLLRLFCVGFVLTGVYVGMFSYLGFRLKAAPYDLGQGQISMLFLIMALGMVSSSLTGRLGARFGRRNAMLIGLATMTIGAAITLSTPLGLIIAGVGLVTIGFFITHATASAAVGAVAKEAKGHASSLYLLFYYVGSSLIGLADGWAWQGFGWAGVAVLTMALTAFGMASAAPLRFRA